jgi:hypothetical protein
MVQRNNSIECYGWNKFDLPANQRQLSKLLLILHFAQVNVIPHPQSKAQIKSDKMTAASNFFRRYTSTAQDGVAKHSIDQIDPIVEFKTLNEASLNILF